MLSRLPNLGPTLVARLAEVGVRDRSALERLGPARVYQQLALRAGKPLPRCYYLYSLEGALRGLDWRALPTADKQRLCREAGLRWRA